VGVGKGGGRGMGANNLGRQSAMVESVKRSTGLQSVRICRLDLFSACACINRLSHILLSHIGRAVECTTPTGCV
jgi:hypothetical protein